jgi:hypothetical protein
MVNTLMEHSWVALKMERELRSSRMVIAMRETTTMENSMAWVPFTLYRCIYLGELIEILGIVQRRLSKR